MMANNTCPHCGRELGPGERLVKLRGRMMCAACAAETMRKTDKQREHAAAQAK